MSRSWRPLTTQRNGISKGNEKGFTVASRAKQIIVIDWETSGIRNDRTPSTTFKEGPQGIQIGAVVCDLENNWEELGAFESDVKFIGAHDGVEYGEFPKITWSESAQEIHGLDLEHLSGCAHPRMVGHKFGSFMKRWFSKNNRALFAAHNPQGDIYYTKQFLWFAGLHNDPDLQFHHRMLDSFSIGNLLWDAQHSDELFKITSEVERGKHGALEDARLCANALRRAYAVVRQFRQPIMGTNSG